MIRAFQFFQELVVITPDVSPLFWIGFLRSLAGFTGVQSNSQYRGDELVVFYAPILPTTLGNSAAQSNLVVHDTIDGSCFLETLTCSRLPF